MQMKTKQEEQKQSDIARIQIKFRVARFKGTTLYMADNGYWQPLYEDYFRAKAYEILTTPMRSRINEVWDFMQLGTPDLTKYSQYIRMGNLVWDTVAVDFTKDISTEDCVYATPVTPLREPEESKFILSIAGGDETLYDTILQTIAPIFLSHKPAGVIWWKGNGRNGKTTLAQVLYDLFPGFISNLTIKQIEDERDAPVLNGNLANIVKESSDGFIQDSKAYKSIGTHESFPVHRFHSQQSIMIDGGLHHIFSANNIPVFADKSDGAKRRTLIIPFDSIFQDDPTFIEKTFTPEFYAQHLGLFLQYARILKNQDYHYQFNERTIAAKYNYDVETNSAVTYLDELLEQSIFGFDNFGVLRIDYESWCSDNGYSVLGRNHLRRATEEKGYHQTTIRNDDGTNSKRYVHDELTFSDLVYVGGMRQGLWRHIDATTAVVASTTSPSLLQEMLDAIPD